MRYLVFSLAFLSPFLLCAQHYETLEPIPEPVSNNAVCAAMVDGVPHVYSFSGIDGTKLFSGIHKRAWSYNVDMEVWSDIPELPLGAGRIAAGASTVKNKIYIIGGYQVFSNGSEASFNNCLLYTSPSPRDQRGSRMPSSA